MGVSRFLIKVPPPKTRTTASLAPTSTQSPPITTRISTPLPYLHPIAAPNLHQPPPTATQSPLIAHPHQPPIFHPLQSHLPLPPHIPLPPHTPHISATHHPTTPPAPQQPNPHPNNPTRTSHPPTRPLPTTRYLHLPFIFLFSPINPLNPKFSQGLAPNHAGSALKITYSQLHLFTPHNTTIPICTTPLTPSTLNYHNLQALNSSSPAVAISQSFFYVLGPGPSNHGQKLTISSKFNELSPMG